MSTTITWSVFLTFIASILATILSMIELENHILLIEQEMMQRTREMIENADLNTSILSAMITVIA
jgi:hypothetical protein